MAPSQLTGFGFYCGTIFDPGNPDLLAPVLTKPESQIELAYKTAERWESVA